ncbi:cAMP-binding protein [Solibacillus sp. FSL H8-0538]|uniref:cAMP-binding protein n=1 Tax=Solibacillus sp. FSL H8-0538 TaxID=2921400 RepID=UPI0030FAEB99
MKENSKTNQEEKTIQQVKGAFGFSQNDSKALLTHAAEVQTTDIIPLDELNKNAKVDSSTTKLNTFHDENTSAILDRDGPR